MEESTSIQWVRETKLKEITSGEATLPFHFLFPFSHKSSLKEKNDALILINAPAPINTPCLFL